MKNRHCRWSTRSLCLLLAFTLGATSGCHSLKLAPTLPERTEKADKDPVPAAPVKHSFRVSQYVFSCDFDLKRDQPIFHELSELRDQVYKELQLPPSSTLVQVFIFEDRDKYERFMRVRFPDLPKRRAFFVAQPRSVGGAEDLLVYTYWGERVREDLRHELTHALLHSVLKDVPLWLDEGLAEYFELPPERQGINSSHLEQLRHGSAAGVKPNLARLEQLSQVQQMTPAEYREAWAWVRLMLKDKPEFKTVLIAYLQQLRINPNPGLLQPRLVAAVPALDDALETHLAQLENGFRSTPSVQK